MQLEEPLVRPVSGARERALGRRQRRVLLVDGRDEDVVPVLREIAEAGAHDALVLLAPVLPEPAAVARDLDPAEVLAQDEVDHTGDCIAAVDRRGAVLQDLHALDGGERDRVHVDGRAVERVVRDAPAVEQHQRVAGTYPAQVDARKARGPEAADR
jgi:hypothetical protein